ncbi:MAG: palindromic element RPE1 domain-containing protein [Rickettsia endosymbiont of Ixodes persulcatus]|nr:palindromic element RPE1 domain-containing protein [Rickettsia endosymbiont of Ixodes persulcatus]MCZ6903469.1 palindromic element RPE1 domain-containing protein [Rickettsia endosymbiont of Ixodes persulcatus]MCZ6909085.1 palindromic element RPE1 domain-containing protein [Rickettsia endosymbiont of Ixodes persulcatus]MCZ6910586.1 palindromic element RPE1 domain-containing protein [Rickettsia endosymbiont of Ixodes persulcatus]MCZ6915107.1 palindromic element RPE1 domain-containing protein [
MAADYSFLESFAEYIIDKLYKGEEVQIILPNNFSCLELKKILTDKYKIKLPVIIPFTSIISKKNLDSDYVSKIEELFILSEIITEYKELPFNIEESLKAAEILRKLFNDLILNNIDIKLIEVYNNSNYWQKIYKFLEYCFLRWQEEISLIVNSASFGDRREERSLYTNRRDDEQRSTKWGSIHYTQKQTKAVHKLKLLQEEIIKIKNGNKQIILAGIFKPDPFLKKFEQELKDYIIHYNPSLSAIDFLHNLANKEEFVGDTERRTAAYTNVREDSSTGSTHKLPLEASYARSLNNIYYLEPNDIYEEAKQIAYICSRNKDKRIAIVTDNNKLKRVYCNFLDKYEDLLGNDLRLTNIGELLTSIIKILCNNFDLKTLFLLLKNPLINCPMVQKLELMLSNKNRFISSPKYLLQLQFDNEDIREYCRNLIDILFTDTPHNIQDILVAAKKIAEKLLPTIWEKEGGAELLEFLTNLTTYSKYINLTDKKDFPKIFSFLLSNIKYYKNTESANIIIGSPADLVLCEFDLIILPHFNNENWSPNKKAHPLLSKKALQILNIDYDEIGSTLYSDYFNLFLQNKQVIILNAKKYDGKLTTTSNLFLKLQKDYVSSRDRVAGSSNYMDTVVKLRYDNEFTAPNTFFPTTLSVTDIETLIRNPYGFYAKKILGLRKKDNIWEEPKISDFGNFIHKVLEEYSKNYDTQYINLNLLDKQNALINIGDHILYSTILPVYTKKAWQIKLVAFSKAFILFDIERRKNCKKIYFEIKGELRLNIAGQDIKIIGIADRIEISKSNNITILDYKTGTIPTKKEIKLGLSPQLIIESLMLLENGFTECHSRTLCHSRESGNPVINKEITIAYVEITSTDPYIQTTEIALNIETLNRHKAGLVKLLEHYITNKFFSYDLNLSKYNDYLHLSRCHTAT